MSKILITADLHIHAHRSDQRRVDDGVQCLEWIYETARIAGIKTVVIAGDFFHNRFNLSTMAVAKATRVLWENDQNGISTIMLVGNHDSYYEDTWDVHSLIPFKHWTVIDKPTQIEIDGIKVDFLPYTPRPSQYIDSPPFDSPARVLISHLAIANAILNSRYNILSVEDDTKEKEMIEAERLHKWDKVWLGHYHYGQKVSDKVEYIGSPMQLTFGEADQKKHVVIFDLETHETSYVENKISPRFYIVDNQSDIDRLDITNSYVQMSSSEVIEAKFDLRRKLSNMGAREIEFIAPKTEVTQQTSKALGDIAKVFSDKDQLIDGYVDCLEIPQGLDKTILKATGKEIVHGQTV